MRQDLNDFLYKNPMTFFELAVRIGVCEATLRRFMLENTTPHYLTLYSMYKFIKKQQEGTLNGI